MAQGVTSLSPTIVWFLSGVRKPFLLKSPSQHHWDHCIYYPGRWAPGFWGQGRSSSFELFLTQVTAPVVGADECAVESQCGPVPCKARTEDSGLPPSQADLIHHHWPCPPVCYTVIEGLWRQGQRWCLRIPLAIVWVIVVSPKFLRWPTKAKPPSQCYPHSTGHSQDFL